MKTKFSLREAIALMLTATLGTQLLNAAMILVQGRLYVPSSVGYVANVVSFAIILEPICMLQLPYALPQQISDKRAVQLVAATLLSTLCISLLLGSGALIAYILLPPRRQTLTMVLLGIVLMYTIVAFDVTLLWSAREGRFRSLGGQNVTLAALRALIQLVGGIANSSFTWLLLSEGAGRIGAIFAIQPSRLISVIKQLRPIKISDIKAVLIENWRFPLISVPSTFADNLGGYLPPILITDLYGLQAAGLLFMAQRAVTLPIVLLTRSTADAIHVRSAQILNERPSDLRSFVLRTSIVLAGVGTVAMGGMAAALWILWPITSFRQKQSAFCANWSI